MSYRGMGGYLPVTRRPPRKGDLGDYGDDAFDFSDVLGGSSSIIPSLGGSDTGSSIWDDVSSFVGGLGLTGPAIGSTIAKGVSGLFGSPAGAPLAGSSSSSQKAAVKRALRAAGVSGGHRRMNPGNFKALRRSMRRLTAFEKAARRVLHFTHPSKSARTRFKFPRRRKR